MRLFYRSALGTLAQPCWDFVKQWLTDGSVVDVHGEFFIAVNDSATK